MYSMNRSRWRPRMGGLVAMMAAALVVASCGGSPVSSASGSPSGNASAAARQVQTAKGPVEVKGTPSRVVVLDIGQLDDALALGVKPVGMVRIEAGAEPPDYLAAKLQGITEVGTVLQPSLEAIAALSPDLILGSKKRNDKIYDQLTAIAPTILTETIGFDWIGDFTMYADALGKQDEAKKLLAEYQQSVDALKASLGDRREKTQVSILRALPGQVYIYQAGSFVGRVIGDVGLPRNPAQSKEALGEVVTAESLGNASGDVLFYSFYGKDGSALEQLKKLPAWGDINAVKSGKVYEVDDDYWFVGTGYLAAQLILADLKKHLA
jgi:iron complex transport system substrate-binding protein